MKIIIVVCLALSVTCCAISFNGAISAKDPAAKHERPKHVS